MFLSAAGILDAVHKRDLVIDPFTPDLLKPASYLLQLGDVFRRWRTSADAIRVDSRPMEIDNISELVRAEEVELRSGQFILARTAELIGMPQHLLGLLSTTSHLARFGVSVHCSSFLVSPGFGQNQPTALALELSVSGPSAVIIKAGTPVCHLMVAQVDEKDHFSLRLQKSVYEGLEQPATPAFVEEFPHRKD